MNPHPSDLLETVESETGPEPTWTVLFLHGLGDSGHGWAPLAPELVRPGGPAVRFVFPHAPVQPVTLNGGMAMPSWYDIIDLDDIDSRADEAGLLQSSSAVEALIAREAERGVPPERVILGGFSQGGAVAMTLALRRGEPLAGLVALSTYLPMAARTLAAASPFDPPLPVFMGHGLQDPMLPHRAGERAANHLRSVGCSLEWHSYPMGHEACLPEIRDLAAWLAQRLNA